MVTDLVSARPGLQESAWKKCVEMVRGGSGGQGRKGKEWVCCRGKVTVFVWQEEYASEKVQEK